MGQSEDSDFEALDVDFGGGAEPPPEPPILVLILLFLLVCVLSLLSQIGGLLLCIAVPFLRRLHRKLLPSIGRAMAAATVCSLFGLIMALAAFFLVPAIAPSLGRVPLPCSSAESEQLRPVTKWTCFFNRHYVEPDVRTRLLALAKATKGAHYLDAGFPFGSLTPMLPHLSHRHGRDVDLAFRWKDATEPPSPLGYFLYDGPKRGEPQPCAGVRSNLRWDFSWLQKRYAGAAVDLVRTHELFLWLLENGKPRKIMIEPHLAARLQLSDPRVGFQGCDAARHDDHFHVSF